MKWIKTAIMLVIGLSVIPMIVEAISNTENDSINMTYTEDGDSVIVNDNFIHYLENYAITTLGDYGGNIVTNINTTYHDGDEVEIETLTLYLDSNDTINEVSIMTGGLYDVTISLENGVYVYNSEGTFNPTEDDVWTFNFQDVSNGLPPTTTMLMGLIPLVFASGVIFYTYKKIKVE